MDLEFEVSDLNTVPEAARSFYKETDGKYILAVKGAIPESAHLGVKTKLDEFRANNTALLKEQNKFKALASIIGEDGLDPDKLQLKINALAESRVGEMKTTYEAQLQELTDKYTATTQQLSTHLLTDVVTKEALKHGVVESALTDVINRARDAFTVTDGKVGARDGIRNKKGEPLSIEDWVSTLAVSAPHFFGTTQGAGATKPITSTSQPALSTHEKLVQGLARLRK